VIEDVRTAAPPAEKAFQAPRHSAVTCQSSVVTLPLLTVEWPGIGGVLRSAPEDFSVIEELAYAPSGSGEHLFLFIEKRDATTPFAVSLLAKALGAQPRDLGYAGMKDRRAVTRQWISVPPPITLAAVQALQLEGVKVLEAVAHPHKLRTGHLRANHFALVVRGVAAGADAVAGAVLEALAAPPGAPNWYGEQRFGRSGDNAAQGLALVRNQRRFDRDPRKNRLLISALQSEVFNRWLSARLDDGLYRRVLPGDVLRKVGGGVFVCEDPSADQPRLLNGQVVVTGPMIGVEMRRPPPGSEAARREAAVFAEVGIEPAELAAVRRLAPGTRRDATILIGAPKVTVVGDDAVRVEFTLPAGAYATAVMRELQKHEEAATAATPATPNDAPEEDAEAEANADAAP
jgi:tRNA pseudouridine13 synthase